MKINTDRLENIGDHSCIEPLWNNLFDHSHGNFILAHGDKGTGKTFTLTQLEYIASKFNTVNFSNILFQKKISDGNIRNHKTWEEHYPESVDFTQSFAEMLGSWSDNKLEDYYKNTLLVIDEFEIFIQYAMSKASKLTQVFLQQNRKLDMCVLGMVHDWGDLPNDVLKWAKYLILKEKHLARQYINRYGVTFDWDKSKFKNKYEAAEKKLAFIIPKVKKDYFIIKGQPIYYKNFKLSDVNLNDVREVILIEQDGCPWNKDPEDAEVGDIIYESKSPANFDIGTLNGAKPKTWWPEFKTEVWPSLSSHLPKNIKKFYNEYKGGNGNDDIYGSKGVRAGECYARLHDAGYTKLRQKDIAEAYGLKERSTVAGGKKKWLEHQNQH